MQKKKTVEIKYPEPEVIRKYLLDAANAQKKFLTEEASLIRDYANIHDNHFLSVAINYNLMVERIDDNIRDLEKE